MSRLTRNLELQAPEDAAGTRIDKFLATLPEIRTRSRAAKLIQQGNVRVNSKDAKASYSLVAGDKILISLQGPAEPQAITPFEFPLNIVFEDDQLIVIDKPSGLVTHPATSHQNDTLVNALLAYTTDLSMGFHEQRPGIVHRLDKDTSGLIVIAKNDRSHEHLAKQFHDKTSHRVYWAVVYGTPKPPEHQLISHLIRHPTDRKKFASAEKFKRPASGGRYGGKQAVTNYRVLSESHGLSHVEVKLETGRTHQIRVHLSEIGHAIAGDPVYSRPGRIKELKSLELRKIIGELGRFALHARELGFNHPVSGEFISFTSPWPENLRPLIDFCGFAE